MHKQVLKYPIDIRDSQLVEMAAGAEILDVQSNKGELALLVMEDPSLARDSAREIIMVQTDDFTPDKEFRYLGSFLVNTPEEVHVFEVLPMETISGS